MRERDDAAMQELQHDSRLCDSVAAQISLHAYVRLCSSLDLKRESVVVPGLCITVTLHYDHAWLGSKLVRSLLSTLLVYS